MRDNGSIRGYRLTSQPGKGGKEVLKTPDGWKPYVYRGDQPEPVRKPYQRKPQHLPEELEVDIPVRHGTVEGAFEHLMKSDVPCFDCALALEDHEYNEQKKKKEERDD